MSGRVSSPGVTVSARLLAILGCFDDVHRALTLSELATRAGLPLPTAHRLTAELAGWGALAREPSGRYVIGRRVWDLGLLAPSPAGLRELAAPFLNDLYAATRATVHLAERDDDQALYLDRIVGQASVPVVSAVGSRLPLHATGVGKVLLAFAPAEVRDALCAQQLRRVTPYTITQPGRLREQLRRVQRDGYACTCEEMSLGASSVAVPVLDGDGRVIAALGVVVRDLKRARPQLVAALRVAASGITRSVTAAP